MIDVIAKAIETKLFSDSKVHQFIGGNVKSPGLVKGSSYIIKFWSAKSTPQSDNPYWVGQFLGAGTSVDQILNVTPRAKEMTSDQRFFFRTVTGDIVSASNNLGALVVNNDAEQRITFYALRTEAQQDAVQLDVPRVKASPAAPAEKKPVTTPAKLAKQPKAVKQRVARIDSCTDNDTVEQNTALFRSARKVYPKFEMRIAHFRTKEEAETFAGSVKNSKYVKESIFHVVEIKLEDDIGDMFFSNAKKAGAYECFNHTRLIFD
jgi:hypothetical protein